jgi:hypothetical protein
MASIAADALQFPRATDTLDCWSDASVSWIGACIAFEFDSYLQAVASWAAWLSYRALLRNRGDSMEGTARQTDCTHCTMQHSFCTFGSAAGSVALPVCSIALPAGTILKMPVRPWRLFPPCPRVHPRHHGWTAQQSYVSWRTRNR